MKYKPPDFSTAPARAGSRKHILPILESRRNPTHHSSAVGEPDYDSFLPSFAKHSDHLPGCSQQTIDQCNMVKANYNN
jgi:hypothetical protein